MPLQYGRFCPKQLTQFNSIAAAFGSRAGRHCRHDILLDIHKVAVRGDPVSPSDFLFYRSDLSADLSPEIEKIKDLFNGVRYRGSSNFGRDLHFDDMGSLIRQADWV